MKDFLKIFPITMKYKFCLLILLICLSAILDGFVIFIIPELIQFVLFNQKSIALMVALETFGIDATNAIFIGIFLYIIATFVGLLTLYSVYKYGNNIGAVLNNLLFEKLINRKLLFFIEKPESDLVNKLILESNRITNQVILPMLLLINRVILALAILISLLVKNFFVTLLVGSIIITTYLIIMTFIRRSIQNVDEQITKRNEHRIKIIQQTLSMIKEIILSSRQQNISQEYSQQTFAYANALAFLQFAAMSPKYIIEFVAICCVLLFLFYAQSTGSLDIESFVGLMGGFALAGVKLLPASQQIYSSLTSIRGNLNAYRKTMSEINDQSQAESRKEMVDSRYDAITANDTSIRYLSGVELGPFKIQCKRGDLTVIKGPSGSGKSSLLYLLSGLCEPLNGKIKLDTKEVTGTYFQTVSILFQDFSLEEYFGELNLKHVSVEELKKLLENLNLSQIIDVNLKDDFVIAENGKHYSGGQRQRLGILRTITNCKEMMILDEPTSGLDQTNAEAVKNILHELKDRYIVIVISHDPTIINSADNLYCLAG